MQIQQNNFVKPQSCDHVSYPSVHITCSLRTPKITVDEQDVTLNTASLAQRMWRFTCACACCAKKTARKVTAGSLLDTRLGIPVPGPHSW